MEIKKDYLVIFKDHHYQGFLECFLIAVFFSSSIFLYCGWASLLVRAFLAFLLIAIEIIVFLYKQSILNIISSQIQKVYWWGFVPIPILPFIGYLYCPALLYASLHVMLFFHLAFALPKIFTAGEIFLNSHILISLLEYSLTAFNVESTVMYFSFRIFVMSCLIYFLLSFLLGKDPYDTEFLSIKTAVGTALILLIYLIYLCATSYGNIFQYWSALFEMLFGTKQKILVFAYSLAVTYVGMSIYPWCKEKFGLEFVASRKYFHLLGFILFAPGFVLEPVSVLTSLNISLAGVLFLDVARLQWSNKFSFLHSVGNYYNRFSPSELQWKFIFAPASLLGGCMLPIEFVYFFKRGNLSSLDIYFCACGITFLTIGDSVNAILGSKFGSTKIGSSNKTYLGTICCFGFSLATSFLFLVATSNPLSFNLALNCIVSTALMSVVEALTTQNDNYVVTLFYFGAQATFNYFLPA